MRQFNSLRALCILLIVLTSNPALGFELFGLKLFEKEEGQDPNEDEAFKEIVDPQPYELRIDTDADQYTKIVEKASNLYARREKPAQGVSGLLSLARLDYQRILDQFYAEAYYSVTISIKINGEEADAIPIDANLALPAKVLIKVDHGPPFTFSKADLINPPRTDVSADDRVPPFRSTGYKVGEPAKAPVIGEAVDLAIDGWRQIGHAKAAMSDAEIIADHNTNKLEATATIDPGKKLHFGKTIISGAQKMRPEFIRYMVDIDQGEEFDPDAIIDAHKRLSRLGVFQSLRVNEAEDVSPEEQIDILVDVEERKKRRIGFGATYHSIDGFGIEGFWLHRNLFGRAERLRFDARFGQIGKANSFSDHEYLLGLTYTMPGFYTPDTDAYIKMLGQQEVTDNYKERNLSFGVGFDDIANYYLTWGMEAKIESSRVEDADGINNYVLASVEAHGVYEHRDNPLDATKGYYLKLNIQPFYEMNERQSGVKVVGEGRTYHGFMNNRFVLAGKARAGTIIGGDAAKLPESFLFFTGGGGSVRGYGYRDIGVPRDDGEDDDGGLSLLELSGELRYRYSEKIGVVGFVDTGYVGDESFGGNGKTRTGVGLGARYDTAFGPIRLDIATPLDDTANNPISFYIGLGQAF